MSSRIAAIIALVTPAEIEALVHGHHGDPFRVLGPHAVHAEGEPARWEVRALLPRAEDAAVLVDGDTVPMERRHEEGLFVASLDGIRRRYRLRAHYPAAGPVDIEDPYSFEPLLTGYEIHLHAEGTHSEAWRTLGAHFSRCEDVEGVRFAVWAPSAQAVSVAGDFNSWNPCMHPMRLRDGGIWEIFLPGVARGAAYKYAVTWQNGFRQLKADPYAFSTETPPNQASLVWGVPQHEWRDQAWMEERAKTELLKKPLSIYEVHLESWLHGEKGRLLNYRELADVLVPYASKMGFTHLELLPVMEHPFSGSWGYQVTGYYAPTARFGSPEDFMYFVDRCHQAGIGIILDWVPAHFPRDAHGLARFDGTALYEHQDPRRGEQRDWGTLIFNYGRHEVRAFLLSNALWWLRHYHIDGLRVDAVASMTYLDYSRQHGEWIPNAHGGRENLEALDFLRRFNELAHQEAGAVTIAEESTSFPGVCRPVYLGGLGFTMKWNMGWMHDMLRYFSQDPVHRKFHHNDITFSMLYAFTENFLLPISHDEVVHLKKSLLSKMPGDEWQRFANARAFFSYMFGHPGKKLLFMGQEIGQYEEWSEKAGVRWELLGFSYHRGLQSTVRELNRLYQSEPALYEVDFEWEGFEWIDFSDVDHSVISFLRYARDRRDFLLFVCNFTPVPRHDYRVGVPRAGRYEEIFNSDAERFGGSNMGNGGCVIAEPVSFHGRQASLRITLPPLGVLIFKPEAERDMKTQAG
ncbi:MAG: 1,4-alpha-glucan branching protein GlgB [Acidobacteria bacterium]|nr:1,4-alpha-glucan branching protein GlgB [Acidobacteriota bacterium]